MRSNLAEAPRFADQTSTEFQPRPILSLVPDVADKQPLVQLDQKPDAFFAANAETDFIARRRLTQELGALSYKGAANAEQRAAEEASLPVVAADYFSKDPERASRAKARLTADFQTGVFEILRDNAHLSHSRSTYQKDGFYQYGYSLRAMYANGTEHARNLVERRRRTAETLNELRIEQGYIDGTARTHYFVETSRVPDDNEMSGKTAADHGYNHYKRITMARCTEVDERGNRDTAQAGLIGVGKNGVAFDAQGVRSIHQKFNLDATDGTATADLEAGFWVRKDLIPNRVVDIAIAYDEGLPVRAFFGAEGQTGDYSSVEQQSLTREQRIKQKLDTKIHELAIALMNKDCDQALATMVEYAKDFAAEVCVQDESYDPAQFGAKAKVHIEQARKHARRGDYVAYHQSLNRAQAEAEVIICGGGGGAKKQNSASGNAFDVRNTYSVSGGFSDEEDCEFISQQCPECGQKNVKTRVTSSHIYGSCGCKKAK